MSQQGSYPIGARTLIGSDTLTGVVTGTTADVPVSAVKAYVGGALAPAITKASINIGSVASFNIPPFVPGTLQLVVPIKTTVPGEGLNAIILKEVGGVLKSVGQFLPVGPSGYTDYVNADQVAGSVNPATGVCTLTTTVFVGYFIQWNTSAFVSESRNIQFVAGPCNYSLVPV